MKTSFSVAIVRAFVLQHLDVVVVAIVASLALLSPKWLFYCITFTALAICVLLLSPISNQPVWFVSEWCMDRATKYRYRNLDMTMMSENRFIESNTFQSLQKAIGLLIKDSVLSWYDEFSKDSDTPKHAEKVLEGACISLASKIFRIDRYAFGTEILQKVLCHIRSFNTARLAAGGSGATSFGPSAENLISHFESLSGSHPALQSAEMESGYLFEVARSTLLALLPKKESDSEITLHLLSRFLVKACFLPLLDKLTDPDFIYQIIVSMFDTAELVQDNAKEKPEEAFQIGDDHSIDEDCTSFKSVDELSENPENETNTPQQEGTMRSSGSSEGDDLDKDGEDLVSDIHSGFLQSSQPLVSIDSLHTATWRTRWFVLTSTSLQFFSDSIKKNLIGEIQLHACTNVIKHATSPVNEFVFGLVSGHCTYFFGAANQETREVWVQHLDQLVTRVNSNATVKGISIYEDHSIPKYSVSIKQYQKMFDHAEYLMRIVIERDGDESVATSWEVSRRYREFMRLHRLLQSRFGNKMKSITFPTTSSTFSLKGLDSAHLETRKVHLDNYLQAIIQHQEIGCSYELCQFLGPNNSELFPVSKKKDRKGLVLRFANLVGREVSEFAESVGKRLPFGRKKPPTQFMFVKKDRAQKTDDRGNPFHAFLEKLRRDQTHRPPAEISESEEFVHVLDYVPQDVAHTMIRIAFNLAGHQRWFEKYPQARNLIVKISGGALCKFFENEIDSLVTEEMWEFYITQTIDAVWADEDNTVRTLEMKAREQGKAFSTLLNLFPTVLQRFCTGKEGSQIESAIMCLLSCLHFKKLNRHLVLAIFDTILCHALDRSPRTHTSA